MTVKRVSNYRKPIKRQVGLGKSQVKENKFSEFFFDIKSKFRLKNTIMSTVLLGMLVFISIILTIHAFIIKEQVYDVQVQMRSQVFYNLYCMKEIISNPVIYTSELDDKLLDNYKNKLNEVLKGNSAIELIKDIIITYNDEPNIKRADKNTPLSDKKEKIIIQASTLKNKETLNNALKKYVYKTTRDIVNDEPFIKLKADDHRYNIYMILDKQNGTMSYDNANILSKIEKFEKQFFIVILIISFILIYVLARSISNPLVEMEKTVSKITEGDLSGRLEYSQYDEINKLVKSYNEMANSLQRLYSTLEKQVQDRTVELKSAYAELQSTQAMMVHSEKMKSLGELVAGIMHEINNPINFIYGNMTHLSNYSNDLINIIEEYSKYNSSLKPEEQKDIEELKSSIDYEFLKTDLPDLIKSCKEGADRAKNIIQDLKSFSRMEEVAIADVDLSKEIDTVLNILHNKIKHKAEVHKEYDANAIPAVEAFGGQLNQVFMNILDNAVGAIEEHGDIWIRMRKDDIGKNVIIEVEDNGVGMDSETAEKVFNPFFTTKPVGQGTGLGMSITYKIIKNHQGDIRVESKKGEGTKFIVTLPINLNRDTLNPGIENGENDG